MYIPYNFLLKLNIFKDFFYNKKIEQNCAYIKKNNKKVLKRIKEKYGKSPIKVAFLCMDIDKWKCQSLFDILKEDENFHPFILVTKNHTDKNSTDPMTIEHVKKAYEFFKNKNMETYYCYDIKKDKHISPEKFNPDIIFYQVPWFHHTMQGPVITSKYALSYYVPYYLPDVKNDMEYGFRFHQYIHKYYVLNNFFKNYYSKGMKNKGENLSVVGHTQLDYYFLNKNQKKEKKYVIFAPHWSINYFRENYATFEWSGKFMLEYALSHPEINWVYRPHPTLKRRLLTENIMSQTEIEEYYCAWDKAGIKYEHGEYMDLFSQTQALITDCGSFLTEFLLTEQPVIHLVSDKSVGHNENTEKIVKNYYQAHNLEELKRYLEEIIIQKQDYKKQDRLNILKELELKDNYCAKNILEDLKKEFS